jgi:TatD DNase family protein
MIIIDTHCHLYDETFQSDLTEVIERAQASGVTRFYLPAIDSSEHEAMLALEALYPNVCVAMMGVHPCYIKDNYLTELAIVEKWLNTRKFVAIGEIGLDFYWDKTFQTQQYAAFVIQMQWALESNCPVVIHTRNAMQETINMIKPFAKKGLRGIFHCFSGSAESAQQITDLGLYLGIGGVLTYKNSGLPEVLARVPLEYLVLETDAPYLPPVPFRGKRNESSYLQYIVEKLSEIKNTTPQAIAAATTANAQKILGM